MSRSYSVAERPELGDRLGEIACPTAIVWGMRDAYLRTEIAEELAAQIPTAELSLIDAGHFVMEESPDAVLGALERLLDLPPQRAVTDAAVSS